MTRGTLICLALLAAGWGASGTVTEAQDSYFDIWFEIEVPPDAGSQRMRIQIQAPRVVKQKFEAYLVQAPGRRIAIQGSLAGCPEATGAKGGQIELDGWIWGKPTSRGASAQATRRPDGDYLVRVAARRPPRCRMELIVPAVVLRRLANPQIPPARSPAGDISWKRTTIATTDPDGPEHLIRAVGLVPGRAFQIISAGKDGRLRGTLRQGREVRSGFPVSLEGCGGEWPSEWDRRATFSDAGAGPRGTTTVEIRVRALEVASCSLVATIAVAEGA